MPSAPILVEIIVLPLKSIDSRTHIVECSDGVQLQQRFTLQICDALKTRFFGIPSVSVKLKKDDSPPTSSTQIYGYFTPT